MPIPKMDTERSNLTERKHPHMWPFITMPLSRGHKPAAVDAVEAAPASPQHPRPPALHLGLHRPRKTAQQLLLPDPCTHKPPVLWGRAEAEALTDALADFDDDAFAMLLAAITEQATPEFVVHALAVPSDGSPRRRACIDRLMPYVAAHTHEIERTPSFVAAPLDAPPVRGVIAALDAWMQTRDPQHGPSPCPQEAVLPWETRAVGLVQQGSDAVRFFFEYCSDSQFTAPRVLMLLSAITNERECDDFVCKLLPCLARRNRAYIESRSMQPWMCFARDHGFGATVEAFAARQKAVLPARALRGDLFESIAKAYGPHFVAMLLRALPRDKPANLLHQAMARHSHEASRLAREVADLLQPQRPPSGARSRHEAHDEASDCDTDTASQSSDDASTGIRQWRVLGAESDSSSDSDFETVGPAPAGGRKKRAPHDMWQDADAAIGKNDGAVLARVVEDVRHVEGDEMQELLWYRMVQSVARSRFVNTLLPVVLAAIPPARRTAVLGHNSYQAIVSCMRGCLHTGADPKVLFTPSEMHAFLQYRRDDVIRTCMFGSQFPWRDIELVAEALDDAGKVTLLEIVRDMVADYRL